LVAKCSLSGSVLLKNLLTKKKLESEKPSRVRLDYSHSPGCGSRASFLKSTSSFPKKPLIIESIQLEGLLKFRVGGGTLPYRKKGTGRHRIISAI